jgi:hypothetical protein
MNNNTIFSDIISSILKELVNTFLRARLLLIAKWNIIIKFRWISTHANALIDALSKFDDKKLTNMCFK